MLDTDIEAQEGSDVEQYVQMFYRKGLGVHDQFMGLNTTRFGEAHQAHLPAPRF